MGQPFKLEAVLKHRRYQEENARRSFADAVRALTRQQRSLASMQTIREQYRQALRLKQDAGGSAMTILLYSRYLARLDTEIRGQQQIVAVHAQDKEKKRQALIASLKDRKVIEKLKERHFSEIARDERQKEQKHLSDVAISRYQRRK